LTDQVTVQAPTITSYAVEATLTILPGPDAAEVIAAATEAVNAYVADQHRLGRDVALSGLFAALHQPGVHRVTLTSPAADIVNSEHEVAFCTGVTLTNGGSDE